jgi:hypothetical protein
MQKLERNMKVYWCLPFAVDGTNLGGGDGHEHIIWLNWQLI